MPSPMTMTEKILARASGKDHVAPGENVWVNVDVLMTHDVCGPGTIGVFKKHFGENAKLWDKKKVIIIPDHYIFTKDAMANRNVDVLRHDPATVVISHGLETGDLVVTAGVQVLRPGQKVRLLGAAS